MSEMIQYGVWPAFAPDMLYTIDDFIDCVLALKKSKLNGKTLLHAFLFFCRCTVCLRRDGGHTSDWNFCDITFYPYLKTDYLLQFRLTQMNFRAYTGG